MKIKKKYNGPSFPTYTKIKSHHTDRLAFNFSFLTPNSKYNLDKRSKTVNKNVRIKLLDKIRELSQDDIVTVLNYDKEQGLEQIPEDQVSLRMHPEFEKKSPL